MVCWFASDYCNNMSVVNYYETVELNNTREYKVPAIVKELSGLTFEMYDFKLPWKDYECSIMSNNIWIQMILDA